VVKLAAAAGVWIGLESEGYLGLFMVYIHGWLQIGLKWAFT